MKEYTVNYDVLMSSDKEINDYLSVFDYSPECAYNQALMILSQLYSNSQIFIIEIF